MRTDWERLVGMGLVGFPNSEIIEVHPGMDYLINGPLHGEIIGTIRVRLEDGREVSIPKDISRVQAYERMNNEV